MLIVLDSSMDYICLIQRKAGMRYMNLYEKLVSGYPSGDVSPQDFIDHLTVGADGWVSAWVAIALAVVF